MKIQASLEQLARYNLHRRPAAGRVDLTTEKLKRFNAILDMFAGDGLGQKSDPGLSVLTLLRSPIHSSAYGRLLQALSAPSTQQQSFGEEKKLRPESPAGPPAGLKNQATNFKPALPPTAEFSDNDRIAQSVKQAASKYKLSERLIKSVIRAESNFNPRALSPAGAQGLMQLMPATARELGVVDAYDIEQNIDGGARYLRKMIDRYGGDVAKGLAAYNAGPGTVDRYKGNVPYSETIAYVDRVLKYSHHDA